ncbi:MULTISPECIES: GOLPH3/VPS74 family protein [Streptomyces]|uniref:GPP34 family phosphoprotein n=1 Tax=Streptomyces tendae TaxID=1932 RepID=A0ABX5ZXE6_STRTE|nr:GPP34 family phosphoprotein [Streptomyces tendae]QER88191.1 GPP34 family phosphoprotein [Streptomyces tendae]
MTTARDLALVSADPPGGAVVERGDLSLALAGAELIDLLAAGALTLDGTRLVPGGPPGTSDALLSEAAERLRDGGPGESVEDWLWRRGRDLAARYRAVLEEEGLVPPERRGRNPLRRHRDAAADPSAAARARERWASGDPVLGALAAAAGLTERGSEEQSDGLTDDHAAVLAAVLQAVTELAGERQRRTIEAAAFDNIWRGN